jgi:hypothetical protein
MLRMCVCMYSHFIENHPIRILEDRHLISEVVLSHPLPHFFILLPQSLLKHFDLLPFFRAARDEATPPCALR